jgi:hypothetical protein
MVKMGKMELMQHGIKMAQMVNLEVMAVMEGVEVQVEMVVMVVILKYL